MRSEADSFAILDRALSAAAADEADAVFISVDQNISRFANSQLHQNMSEESAWLTLRVIVNGSMGVASTSSFDDDEIARTAALAREAAKHSDPLQKFNGLYRDNEPVAQLDTFDEATAHLSPAEKALDLRAMFDRGREAGVEFAGVYSTGGASVACGNTHGVRRYCRMTHADATIIALTKNSSGYATQRERRVDRISIRTLGDEAILKATLRAGVEEDLAPGAYDVILEPPALAEVFDWMNMITFTGQSYEDGSSFFVGNIGKKFLGDNLTLVDDSNDETFLPFPFDMEGLPRKPIALIERGVIRTPMVDKAWSDRLSFAPTAGAWHLGSPEHGVAFHLAMAGGTATRDELIASTKLGIWVTRFNYVNGLLEPKMALMTGTTRDGTFLVRDGEVVARLPNLRWTQSMVEAFSNIEALTAERRIVGTWYNMFGGTLAPVVKVRGWNFTGKQESLLQ
ncbi:MAG TPA: TldD/PmbA family protein [Thermoanaerobaculia bacterium]|nr:TldD/PmbA family protein [Thermoanaerobaculia bacterium]